MAVGEYGMYDRAVIFPIPTIPICSVYGPSVSAQLWIYSTAEQVSVARGTEFERDCAMERKKWLGGDFEHVTLALFTPSAEGQRGGPQKKDNRRAHTQY